MTSLFTGAQIIVQNATAVAGAPKISNDTIDVAMSTMASFVFTYCRAKRWTSPAASGLGDRGGNPITTQHTGQTFTSSDSDFGGQSSVNFAACADTPYVVMNRGAAPPGAFTFLASLKLTAAQAAGKVCCLFSQTEGVGTLGFTVYAPQTPNGSGHVQGPGNVDLTLTNGSLPTLNVPCIFVCSYDPVGKIARAGLNGLPSGLATAFTTGPSPGSSDVFRLFGNVLDNGDNALGKFETAAIFNAAAGIGGAIDAPLSSLISTMRGAYGF